MTRRVLVTTLIVLIELFILDLYYVPLVEPDLIHAAECVEIATPEWWAAHPDAIACTEPSPAPTTEQQVLPNTAMEAPH